MNCPTCNAPNPDNSRFCSYCGASLVVTSSAARAVPPRPSAPPPPARASSSAYGARPAPSRSAREDDDDDLEDVVRRRYRLTPHRGGAVLTFGILGLTVCVIFAVVAWVMGNNDLREMRAGRMDRAGESNTNAGRICGMVGTILGIVGLVFVLVMVLATGGSRVHSPRGY